MGNGCQHNVLAYMSHVQITQDMFEFILMALPKLPCVKTYQCLPQYYSKQDMALNLILQNVMTFKSQYRKCFFFKRYGRRHIFANWWTT